MERGERGDAHIDVPAEYAEFDAPVLRQPSLGDIQSRHQLESRHDRRPHRERRCIPSFQNAVDAKAHLEVVLERLQMNVAGPLFEGFRDHGVHVSNHGSLGGHVAQLLDVVSARLGALGFLRRAVPLVDRG